MRLIQLLVFSVVMLFLLNPIPAESAPVDWAPYASEEGRFVVEFPGTVERQARQRMTPIGPIQMNTRTATFGSNGTVFTVAFNDLPVDLVSGLGDGRLILEGAVAEKISRTGGTLIHDRALEVDGRPARFVILETGEGESAGFVSFQVVLHENRVFQLSCAGSKGTWRAADNRRFFASFAVPPADGSDDTSD